MHPTDFINILERSAASCAAGIGLEPSRGIKIWNATAMGMATRSDCPGTHQACP